MNRPRISLGVVCFLLLVAGCLVPSLPAQQPHALCLSPLLHVRFLGPPGSHVTLYQGQSARAYPTPVSAGLRPGYVYRVQLSGLRRYPGVDLFPTLEVRGTLHVPPRVRAADYPAPVFFSDSDIDRVMAGSLLTKVVYLEDPEQAVPAPTRPDEPLEMQSLPGSDPLTDARALGRPMLIVRLGQRDFTPEEMLRQSVGGTILLPGEKMLSQPSKPPFFPWVGIPLYDPTLGPRKLSEECLQDGGDVGLKAGYGPDGQLRGVNASDTVAEYADAGGRKRLVVSNRVCLCVPRFGIVTSEAPLAAANVVQGPAGTRSSEGHEQLHGSTHMRQTAQAEGPSGVHARSRASGMRATEGLGRFVHVEMLNGFLMELGPAGLLGTKELVRLTGDRWAAVQQQMLLAQELNQPTRLSAAEVQEQGPQAIGQVNGLNVFSTVVVAPREMTICAGEVPHVPERPLVLFKWASAQSARVGDEVTFFLKYSNHGGQPIADIAVVDSLTTRLEYVPGSGRSDRPAVFTTELNEAGSLILRWEITGRLMPGESGVVSFRARVR